MTGLKFMFLSIGVFVAWGVGHWVTEGPSRSTLLRRSYLEVCRLVDENFFQQGPELRKWSKECFQEARQFPPGPNLDRWMVIVRNRLQLLGVSHLDIWDPESTKATFVGQALETGVRARVIKGHHIVIQLVDGGPALQAGLQIGDEVVSIDGVAPTSAETSKWKGGVFKLKRANNRIVEVKVGVSKLSVDLRPRVEIDQGGVALLQIPSFSRFQVPKEEWLEIFEAIKDAVGLIVDLRGNPGGDFVAMMRVLSTLKCDSQDYGRISKSQASSSEGAIFPEGDGDDEIRLIQTSSEVNLRRFSDYPCYEGPVVVLIDDDSTSTSEVFAENMKSRSRTKVVGDFTPGSVVTASFFPLPLGSLYQMTIPIAMYFTPKGEELEGVGVRPHQILRYDLADARAGEDTWVKAALKTLEAL